MTTTTNVAKLIVIVNLLKKDKRGSSPVSAAGCEVIKYITKCGQNFIRFRSSYLTFPLLLWSCLALVMPELIYSVLTIPRPG